MNQIPPTEKPRPEEGTPSRRRGKSYVIVVDQEVFEALEDLRYARQKKTGLRTTKRALVETALKQFLAVSTA